MSADELKQFCKERNLTHKELWDLLDSLFKSPLWANASLHSLKSSFFGKNK